MNKTTERCNEALTHHRAGRLEIAESLYREILVLDAGHAEAHHNLGVIEIERGRYEAGLAHLRQALELAPGLGGYWLSLAEGLLVAQRFDEAHSVMERARLIGLDTPDSRTLAARIAANRPSATPVPPPPMTSIPPAQEEAVAALLKAGQLAEAEALVRRLAEAYPDAVFGWKAAGTILFKRDQSQAALPMLQRAISLMPRDPECLNTLGNTLHRLGRFDDAQRCFRQALDIDPNYAAAHTSLGVTVKELGRIDEAMTHYRRALELKPDLANAHSNLGAALKDLGRLDEALACYERALAIHPDSVEAHNNRGITLQNLGRLDEAIDALDCALTVDPGLSMVYSNRLFTLNYHPDRAAPEIFAAYRDFDQRFGEPQRTTWSPHTNDRDPDRRLRIGYVSPDFRLHSARHFLEPLLAQHDRRAVEITAYAELAGEDEFTARYRGYADHWVATRGLNDAELAERIRADRIDILVDLAGHTVGNRLGVFARRPAPVSISWMGFGYTTGLSAIDYFLADEVMAPPGSEDLFAEWLWRIEAPWLVYRPAEGMGAVGPLPALDRGAVTFGTLTRAVRINHRVIRVWSAILQRVTGSRLVIDSRDFITASAQAEFAERFAAHGIDPERLAIGYHSPPWDVLRGIDIGLDCFPHNSGTTLIESLYLGVPFITLADRPSVGRIGSSVLTGAGHPEWIAASEDDYIDKAVALAGDPERLATIRARLRGELETGPWRDEAGFARRVERAYREMWQRWCVKHA